VAPGSWADAGAAAGGPGPSGDGYDDRLGTSGLLEQLGADGIVVEEVDAVWVGDAVAALAVVQLANGVVNIVDDEPAPASEWRPYLAACTGAKRPMRVPQWPARPLAGDVAVTMMTEGRGFSNAKAKRELAWELHYPSWRHGFTEGLA
jgi:nucleoside-diphosphate-sugar epimerase